MNNPLIQTNGYKNLLTNISGIFADAQARAIRAINTQLLENYWRIGQYIVEFEQGGLTQATYGKALLENLSKDLSKLYGKERSLGRSL